MNKVDLFTLPLYVRKISGNKNGKDYEFIVYESSIHDVVVNFVPVYSDKKILKLLVDKSLDKQ